MSVTISTIQAQDSIASSRLTLNSNFSALKAGIDSVHLLLDPTTAILSGVKSVVINDNAVPSSTSILQVGKGSSLLGNVIMGTTGATTSVLVNGNGGFTIVQSNLILGNGNLNLSSASSVASFGGHLSVQNENRLPGVANAFASMWGLTQQTLVTLSNCKYLVVTNGATTAGTGMTAQLPAGSTGQVLEIFHIKGASGYPVWIKPSVNDFYGLTGPIQMSETGDTIKLIYDGTLWYLWSYNPSSFATSGGATGSSITFSTIV